MKRHADLLQLSREHHTALKQARLARIASDTGSPEAIAEAALTITCKFAEEIEAHFLAEEKDILPALLAHGETDLVNRTLDEHKILRALNQQLQQPDGATLAYFSQILYDHVRFEERALFERGARVALPRAVIVTVNRRKALNFLANAQYRPCAVELVSTFI